MDRCCCQWYRHYDSILGSHQCNKMILQKPAGDYNAHKVTGIMTGDEVHRINVMEGKANNIMGVYTSCTNNVNIRTHTYMVSAGCY